MVATVRLDRTWARNDLRDLKTAQDSLVLDLQCSNPPYLCNSNQPISLVGSAPQKNLEKSGCKCESGCYLG